MRIAYYNGKVKSGPQNLITYASKADYLARRSSASPAMDLKTVTDGVKKTGMTPDKAEISETAKAKAGENIKDLGDDVKEKVKEVPKKIKDKVLEGKSAGSHLLSQAGSALLRGISSIGVPGIPSVDLKVDATEAKQVKPMKSEGRSLVNKPGIFFIKGFSLNPFASDDEGLPAMAKNIPSSKVFSWSEEDAVIDEIKKRPHTQPIILVGHGMGGDTAVSITNKLNSVDHGFRRVDLLVTLDSVGTDNDIIPQNVRENYNLISDQDWLFNDGPNVARKKALTKVDNLLITEDHNNMDKNPEIQFLVYEKINTTLMDAIRIRDFKNKISEQLIRSHQFPSPASSLSRLGQL